MLTRRPLIPHLRVRAWDSGTDYVHRDLRERETMFRTIRLTAAALAVAVASLALAGTASAHVRGVPYEFRGAAVVAPGTGATQIQVQVDGGNRLGPQGPARRRTAHDLQDRRPDPLDRRERQHAGARLVRHRARRRSRARRRPRPVPHAARDAARDAGRERHRSLGPDAPRRSPVPVRRHGSGHRHDQSHDHGRRQLRQLARALRPARPARAPDVHLRRQHRVPEVAPRRADRRRPRA